MGRIFGPDLQQKCNKIKHRDAIFACPTESARPELIMYPRRYLRGHSHVPLTLKWLYYEATTGSTKFAQKVAPAQPHSVHPKQRRTGKLR